MTLEVLLEQARKAFEGSDWQQAESSCCRPIWMDPWGPVILSDWERQARGWETAKRR